MTFFWMFAHTNASTAAAIPMTSRRHEPMLIAHYLDATTGAEAWLVVDLFLHGVAGGGIRMAPDVSEELIRELAATMSIKLSILQPPLGGAKCGIRFDARAPESKDVLYRVVGAFSPFLRNCWVTGSDLGTDWSDVVHACQQYAGIPHPQFALMKAYGKRESTIQEGLERLSRGTSLVVDESIDLRLSNAVTGWTVFAATEEALRVCGESLQGKRIAIQGFGAVGGSAAKFFHEAGAFVVAVSDELGAMKAPNGKSLDIPHLLRSRMQPGRKIVDRSRLGNEYNHTDRDAVLYLPVDIVIPAAGSHLKIEPHKVQARYIIEGANDPFTEEEEIEFHKRGIIVVPDAIANAGNAALFGLLVSGHVPIEKDPIFEFLRSQVQAATRSVLAHSLEVPRRVLVEHARTQIRSRIAAGHSFLPNGILASDFEDLQSEHLHILFRPFHPYAEYAGNQYHTTIVNKRHS